VKRNGKKQKIEKAWGLEFGVWSLGWF